MLNNKEFKVEPKIMQVLCYLMAHQGEVVSRQNIAQDLWPESITGLEVVTRAVFELRKILKDDAKKPRFIETISRKGYCFIHDIEASEHQTLLKPNTSSLASRKLLVLITAFVSILVCAFIIFFLLPKNNERDFQSSLLTHTGIYADMPAISPDWKQIVFVKSNSDKRLISQLILLDLTTQKQKIITAQDAHYRSPAWGKSGRNWFYLRCTSEGCGVIKHNIINDTKQTLFKSKYKIFSMVVSPDQKSLMLVIRDKGLYKLAQLTTSDEKPVLAFINAPDNSNGKPIYSADGRSLYFVSWVRGGTSHLYRYDIADKNYHLVSDEFNNILGIALKTENSLWISGRRHGVLAIWSLNLNSHALQKEFNASPGEFITDMTTSVEAERLIYRSVKRNNNIEYFGEQLAINVDGINSALIDMNAVYSEFNKVLYFISNRTGAYEIWRSSGKQVEKVTNIQANKIERPILSKKQNKLAYAIRNKKTTEINLLDLKDNTLIKQFKLPHKVFLLSWSNDGAFIYFSAFENKKYNIFKLDTETGEQEKILLNSGLIAQESDDGGLYYGDMANRQLMFKSSQGEVKILFKLDESYGNLMPHLIKVIGENVYFVSKKDNLQQLNVYSFKDKTTRKYADLPKDAFVSHIGKAEQVFVVYDLHINDESQLVYLQQ